MNINESFLKVNKAISNLWGKIEERRDQKKLPKFKHWSANVEKKVAQVLPLTKQFLDVVQADHASNAAAAMNGPGHGDGSPRTERRDKVHKGNIYERLLLPLTDLTALLSVNLFKHDLYPPDHLSSSSSSSSTHSMHPSPSPSPSPSKEGPSAKGEAQNHLDPFRSSVLDLWRALLELLERGAVDRSSEKDIALTNIICNLILMVLKRREFDPSNLYINMSNPSDQLVDIASRYRALLYQTQIFVSTKLSIPIAPMNPFHQFCARVLAVTFFRVPVIGQCIMSAVVPDQALLENITALVPPFGSLADDDPDMQAYTSSYPVLFGWPQFHYTVTELRPNTWDDRLSDTSKAWLTILAKRESIFFSFFKEWILYIRHVVCGVTTNGFSNGLPTSGNTSPTLFATNGSSNGSTGSSMSSSTSTLSISSGGLFDGSFHWRSFPGFVPLLHAMLLDMRTRDQGPPPISRPTPQLELQYLLLIVSRGELLNAFVQTLFLHTNAHDVPSVVISLNITEAWLRELNSQHLTISDKTFNVGFFCDGLHIILSSDHHQLVGKVLALVYNYADMFVGTSRRTLFSDLLLRRHFFDLFLHWDPSVRNAFDQVLIFRMVRIKRSLLYSDGIAVREYGKANQQSRSRDSMEVVSSASMISNGTPPQHEPQPSSPRMSSTSSANPGPSPSSSTSSIPSSSSSDSIGSHMSRNVSFGSAFLENDETALDVELFLKLEAHVKMVGDQIRDHNLQYYPSLLEAYVPAALAEYNTYLSRYYSWEQSGAIDPPKMNVLSILGNKLDG
eukprot:TRINITY_DN3469_c0_g1_i5.p1 TRINITY_DN3469_c0_g1~~TRINITY_DN3469_c0_g1_i5.p1  ORF type:complete len:787 (-),score=149.84 TRINITY_DN3469_c0_g1_i5:121-2481(-)